MVAGRVGGWERLQYRVRIENPTLSHEGARIIAILLVPYGRGTNRVDYLRLLLDYMRYVDANGNPIYLLTYTVGLDATDYTDTIEVGLDTQELVVELVEPRWYTTLGFLGDPVWDVRWQDLRIFLNGVEITHPFDERSILTVDYYPASMPMGAAELIASSYAGLPDLNDYDNCRDTYTVTSVATARVVGGYRCRESGEWHEFPIHYEIPSLLEDECATGLDALPPEFGGSTTWNASIVPLDSLTIQNVYHGTVVCRCFSEDDSRSINLQLATGTYTVHSRSGQLFIFPDLPRQFVAIGDVPHEYLMYRAPLPSVNATRAVSSRITEKRWNYPEQFICRRDNAQPYPLHPQRAELLYVHDGNTTNPLSDGLDEHVHSLVMWSSSSQRTIGNGWCGALPCPVEYKADCPPPFDFAYRTYSLSRAQSYMVGTQCHPYYRHPEPALRYWNTHAAPMWSYICWLQDWGLDRNGDGVAEPTRLASYWRPHQCQHIEHSALPESVRSRRRSYLLLDTLANGTWSAWIYELFGIPSGWVGSVRPALVPILQHGQLQLTRDSRPRWSATNATLSFDATGITVTPTDTTHTLTFTLADFRDSPFLYPAVADKIVVNYPSEAYSSLTIELVSVEGEMTTIATSGGEHSIPYGSDSKYAGTWARRYEALIASYTEQGVDTDDTRGRSVQTFDTPERALLWLLLNARAGETIRFTVQQRAPTPYTLPYPVFKRDAVVRFTTDNGAHTNPAIYGNQMLNWGVLEYPLATNTPSVRLPHEPMTLYDACALYEQLELGKTGDSTAEIVNRAKAWGFDSLEFHDSPVILKHRSRAVMMPYVSRHALWIQNDWRECPPLPTLPCRRLRFEPDFGFTGDWGQWVYWSAPSRRYYLTTATDIELIEDPPPTGTVWTTTDRVVGRFRIYAHDRAVDGTETMYHPSKRWFLRWRDPDTNDPEDRFARLTPFFSHAWVYTTSQPEQSEETRTPIDALNEQRAVSLMLASQHIVIRYPEQTTVAHMTPYSEWLDIKSVPIVHGYIGVARRENDLVVVLFVENEYQEGIVVNGKYAVLGYKGETREVRVWYNAGDDDDIFTRVSRDWGISFEPAVPCVRDGGTALRGVPLDATLALIQHAFYLVVREGETHRVLSSEDGVNWTTVLTL